MPTRNAKKPVTSRSLEQWQTTRASHLDELEAALAAVEVVAAGREQATAQLHFSYAMMLSSQFQGYCRDIHTEVAMHLTSLAAQHNPHVAAVLRGRLLEGRKLDQANPTPGNIGSDFGRFAIRFWALVEAHDAKCAAAMRQLDQLAVWRNAIAHNDFTSDKLGGKTVLNLDDVRGWRRECDLLAATFDAVLRSLLVQWFGPAPWDWR